MMAKMVMAIDSVSMFRFMCFLCKSKNELMNNDTLIVGKLSHL